MERPRLVRAAALVGRSAYLLIALLLFLFAYPFVLDGSREHRLILGFLNVVILVSSAYAGTATRRAFLLVVVFLGLPAFGLQAVHLVTGNPAAFDLLFL